MKHLIVTPCFNSAKLLTRTFDSILSQSSKEIYISYVVVDGASSDDTLSIIEAYKDRMKNSGIDFSYISEPDKGMYDAIAKGFLSKSHEIYNSYSYINAGDFYAPRSIINVTRIFNENCGIHWITGLNIKYNMNMDIFSCRLPGQYPRRLIKRGIFGLMLPCVQQESSFWTGSAHKIIEWDKLRKLKLAGDYFIWKCLAQKYELHVVGLWLGGFTVHPGQLSDTRRDDYYNEIRSVADNRNILDYMYGFYIGLKWLLPEAVRKDKPIR